MARPEIEDMLMTRGRIPYKEARSLVLECRKELGMTPYEPWTEELKAKAEALYELRYKRPLPSPSTPTYSDNDSTMTHGTVLCPSLSSDNSDDADHVISNPPHVRPSSIRLMMKAPKTVDIIKAELKTMEDHTDTDPTEEAEPVADDANAATSGNQKKERKSFLARIRSVGRKKKTL